MLKRRSVIRAITGGATLWNGGLAHADTDDMPDYNSPTVPALDELGTQPATMQEVQVALEILARCPTDSPLAAMTFLSKITEKNADNELYNAGWRTRWNPVIVDFFKKTGTTPSGDITPWCAASMNWVLSRCSLKGTGSASSSSFRNASGKTGAPKLGDVVVFRSSNSHEANLGHGHVALFISRTADKVLCLGGNQVHAGHHAIMQQTIATSGFLTLDSFHSIEAFRKA